MSERLSVHLDGRLAGTLTQNERGFLSFTYVDSYLARVDAYPLSLSMPLGGPTYGGRPTLAYLAGLLPDNPDTLRRYAREFGVSPNNPFALLRHLGKDAAGAVQIVPEDEPSPDAGPRAEKVRWLTESEISAAIESIIASGDWDAGFDVGRWSLSGAQGKLALFRDEATGRWGIPEDSTPTTHILKPGPDGRLRGHQINEFLTMRTAGHLGLPTAEAELVTFGENTVFVVKRYDRVKTTSGWVRIHQEDLCQALGVMPSKKYQADGGPGVSQIASTVNGLTAGASRARLFDALAFNVAVGNTDAHAKNYSVLISAQATALAPLYDAASVYAYRITSRPQSAMKIGDHLRLDQISVKDWAVAGRRLGLAADESAARVRRIQSGLLDAFDAAAAELPALPSDLRTTRDLVRRRLQQVAKGRSVSPA